MKGITFGTSHSFNSWGLYLTDKEIGVPTPKTSKVDVEGADGELDYTEYFGEVKFKNRKLKFTFETVPMTTAEFLELISDIQDDIHGKLLQVVLDDDPDYYYVGRALIADLSHKNAGAKLVIEVDAEPYKWKKNATRVKQTVTGTSEIVLTNDRKTVVPTITTTASMTIGFEGGTASVNAGTFRLPQLQLVRGENKLTVTGTGDITFEYQEGRL